MWRNGVGLSSLGSSGWVSGRCVRLPLAGSVHAAKLFRDRWALGPSDVGVCVMRTVASVALPGNRRPRTTQAANTGPRVFCRAVSLGLGCGVLGLGGGVCSSARKGLFFVALRSFLWGNSVSVFRCKRGFRNKAWASAFTQAVGSGLFSLLR